MFELGVEAETAARLNATYRRFVCESDPKRMGDAGIDLILAIFGTDAVAEDSILEFFSYAGRGIRVLATK